MKFRFIILSAIIFLIGNSITASAQIDTVIGQITNSTAESFVTGISGDGRFVVMESTGNIATENPRNADGNREVFLFDYAQRRIFQITDTKSLLTDPTLTTIYSNIKVDIVNQRPVISNDGRRISFSSNATYAYPGNGTIAPIISDSNPGNFDANAFTPTTGTNNLVNDGNTEIWIYDIPATSAADLSSGEEIPLTNLSGGTFTRVTNTLPSRLPVAGTNTTGPVIADDNRDPSINDNGNSLSFVSTRDLVPCATTPTAGCGNAFPDFDNAEIYTYTRSSNTFGQVTATPRGTILAPIYNLNPNISGNGLRVSFLSNGDNPIVGMTGGSNSDRTDEIFYADLDATGRATGTKRQVTQTTGTVAAGTPLNIFSYGRRMSRDGRYIAFESFADLTGENSGNNYSATAVFVFDANASTTPATAPFRRIAPRADADSGVTSGDILRFPTFTDYDTSGTPQTVILSSRLNINSSGTIPSTASEGLNSDSTRPPQIYSYQLSLPAATAKFTRVSKFPASSVVANTQAYASNTFRRIAFTLAQTELGTGNFDGLSESYYLLTPIAERTISANTNFATGASRLAVTESPVPTPSPTATPTATPTPSPTATPTATPTPTPQTPPAVQGLAPGMLAILNYDTGFMEPLPAATAVGSISRSFQLPMELAGVTMTIDGATVGLKSVSRREIVFVVPTGLILTSTDGTSFPFVLNIRGSVIKGKVRIVPVRPDIFTTSPSPGPNGRARAQNITNRVPTTEPFSVTTHKLRGGVRKPTILRLFLTGVANVNANYAVTVRIGDQTINIPTATPPKIIEPGVYAIDFELPSALAGAGDKPVIVSVTVAGATFQSRLDDTAPRLRFL